MFSGEKLQCWVITLHAVERLLSVRAEEISSNSFSSNEVHEIQRSVAQLCSLKYTTAGDLYKDSLYYKHCLHTGSPRLDGLLGGGIFTGEITEIQGQSAAGKSQFCFSLTASLVLTTKARVVFIDSTNSFSSSRIAEICEHKLRLRPSGTSESAIEDALGRIECNKIFTAEKLMSVLASMEFTSVHAPIRLLVVDSITALLSPCLGSGIGQAVSAKVAKLLRLIAMKFGIAVVLTNSTVAGKASSVKAALGLTWASVPSTTVFLSCSSGGHLAHIVKSSRVCCNDDPTQFYLSPGGVS